MLILEWDFDSRQWQPREALGTGLELAGGVAKLIVLPGSGGALLASTAARVNGAPPLPLAILSHRDEIEVGGRVFYFVADSPPRIETFHAGRAAIRCARCQGEIADGEDIVRCPARGCHAFHHRQCWWCSSRRAVRNAITPSKGWPGLRSLSHERRVERPGRPPGGHSVAGAGVTPDASPGIP